MQQLRNIDATVTRNGDLYVLTCQDGDETATFETSRELMLAAAAHLRVRASLRSAGGGDVQIRFPGKQVLTLPPGHAAALARCISAWVETNSATKPSSGNS